MDALTTELSSALIAESNDLSLVIDSDGIIRDVTLGSNEPALEVALGWIGRPWIDTVTDESKNKIKSLLNSGSEDSPSRWRQVNHPVDDDLDLPMMYKAMRAADGETIVAVGRDLRQVSQLQQRLLDVQQSLERDYARLHQAEIRYRMLFSMASTNRIASDAIENSIR